MNPSFNGRAAMSQRSRRAGGRARCQRRCVRFVSTRRSGPLRGFDASTGASKPPRPLRRRGGTAIPSAWRHGCRSRRGGTAVAAERGTAPPGPGGGPPRQLLAISSPSSLTRRPRARRETSSRSAMRSRSPAHSRWQRSISAGVRSPAVRTFGQRSMMS